MRGLAVALLVGVVGTVVGGARAAPGADGARAAPGGDRRGATSADPGMTGAAFVPLAEVRRGMRGVGRTVIRGARVERFDVEVLDVLRGAGPAGDLVLIRASGPLIARSGGIAAGMSGSPVSIVDRGPDGRPRERLLGAIGFGWTFSDHTLGLVTPIGDMLQALPGASPPKPAAPPLASGGPRTHALSRPLQVGAVRVERVQLGGNGPVPPGVARFQPVAVPLLVAGLGRRALEALEGALRPYGVRPVPGGSGASLEASAPLGPGSAMGAQLVRGDVNLTAIGTVTYRTGDRLVGFGHAFLNRGSAAYLLTPAVIHEVVRSVAVPFKVGSAGAVTGTITQDRRAGVGARVGQAPRTFAVRVRVRDADRGRTAQVGLQVVQDEELGPLLTLLGVLEAFDRALDRIGGGTARLEMVLRGVGLPGPVRRANVYYHPRDIAVGALLELPEALRLLFRNEFAVITPVDLTVEAEVSRQRRTAILLDAVPQRGRVRAGDRVLVGVELRPFHGAPLTRTLEVAVPADFPAGPAVLLVRGGSQTVAEDALADLLTKETPDGGVRSLAEQIATFTERDQNTQLVVELLSGRAGPERAAGRPRTRESTPWVLRGRLQVPLTVEP
ncbi:MAG: hypothetical protein QN122_08470 [Armatimonadota bacterium]|nr:hypothetical protein [Armatimonadota bacterium]MDR7449222.1 hypothetical protein [Armatimonadota bacterium]MDR7459287.1 hypothetical protein [Armatimonadota bacterium]MDR7478341.1 hypothetical protein [Armatimonadota bacterium]MDR7487216.1 hypothetical protein [Armatimonadota bacterium]